MDFPKEDWLSFRPKEYEGSVPIRVYCYFVCLNASTELPLDLSEKTPKNCRVISKTQNNHHPKVLDPG